MSAPTLSPDSSSPRAHARLAKDPPSGFLDQVDACLKFSPEPTTKTTFRTHKAMIPVSYNNNMQYLLGMGYQREFLQEQHKREQHEADVKAKAEEKTRRLIARTTSKKQFSPDKREEKPRFVLKQFAAVPAKVDSHQLTQTSPTKV